MGIVKVIKTTKSIIEILNLVQVAFGDYFSEIPAFKH